MLRGIYTSATGMESQRLEHQAIADNLANASTTGYKAYAHVHKSFASQGVIDPLTGKPLGEVSMGSEPTSTSFDFSQGAMRPTGNPLDLAISGEGFFAVQDQQGKISYTRDGHFTLNQDGFVINSAGEFLLDSGYSPIFVGWNAAQTVQVLRNGNFMVNDQLNCTLKPFVFPEDAAIISKGGSKFVASSDDVTILPSQEATIQQGFLEASNVSSVKTSAEMIQVMRTYETNQRAMRAQIETLDMLMNVVDQI
jgi:flagellar basal-body rod protein FlgG